MSNAEVVSRRDGASFGELEEQQLRRDRPTFNPYLFSPTLSQKSSHQVRDSFLEDALCICVSFADRCLPFLPVLAPSLRPSAVFSPSVLSSPLLLSLSINHTLAPLPVPARHDPARKGPHRQEHDCRASPPSKRPFKAGASCSSTEARTDNLRLLCPLIDLRLLTSSRTRYRDTVSIDAATLVGDPHASCRCALASCPRLASFAASRPIPPRPSCLGTPP